jgi:hypothetical protein
MRRLNFQIAFDNYLCVTVRQAVNGGFYRIRKWK